MKFLRDAWQQGEHYRFRLSLGCLAVLTVIHFVLDLYLGKPSHLMMSILMWAAVYSLLREQHSPIIQSRPSRLPMILGYALLVAVLIVSTARLGDKVVGFFPLFAFLSWFLIFIDLANYRQYFREFGILLVFGLPKLIPDSAFGLSALTAQTSAYLLWRVGYPVSVEGLSILMPNGGVDVVPACSGMNLITHMLTVAVIFLSIFPARRSHFLCLPLIAVLLSFLMNSIRVTILALLSSGTTRHAFQYWHSANGASVFVLLTIVLYGCIYWYFFNPSASASQES
jgi:cyanoexosortase A